MDVITTNDNGTVTWSFPMIAGLSVRGTAKRFILAYCAANGLGVSVEEDKGLLESAYTFRVTGSEQRLRAFSDELLRFGKELES